MTLVTSFQVSITPSKRAAGRFVSRVRRALQKALIEEHEKRGVTQSDLARAIGVHRSVISRELNGFADLPLSRAAELAWALGRKAVFTLEEPAAMAGSNMSPPPPAIVAKKWTSQGTADAGPDTTRDVQPPQNFKVRTAARAA